MSVTNLEFPSRIPGQQPTTRDLLRHNAIRMTILSHPNISYHCQSVGIPSISLGVAKQPTALIDIPHPGDKLVLEPLTVKFIVQEDMEDYLEIYRWMQGLGFPNERSEYRRLLDSESYRFPEAKYKTANAALSDVTLHIMDSNNNPNMRVNFVDAFPINLSSIQLDIAMATGTNVYATVTFAYRFFEIDRVTTVNTPVETTPTP